MRQSNELSNVTIYLSVKVKISNTRRTHSFLQSFTTAKKAAQSFLSGTRSRSGARTFRQKKTKNTILKVNNCHFVQHGNNKRCHMFF